MADQPQMVQVRVTHVIDPHNFHAQIGSDESFELLDAQAVRLDELGQSKAEDVSALGVSADHCPGDWVLAFSGAWNKWVRAQLNLVDDESGEVDVNCVDYGTTELVRAECILSEVDETVTGWAPQAYPCTLAGVKPIASVWISRATNYFADLVLGTTVSGQVIGYDRQNQLVLDLLIESESGAISSASDLLFKDGLCKLVPLQPGGALGKVPDFDVNRLHARPALGAGDGQEDEEAEKEEDIEVSVFRSLMGVDEETPKWRPTDALIGENYEPNVDSGSLQALQDDLRQLTAGHSAAIGAGRADSWERTKGKGKPRDRPKDKNRQVDRAGSDRDSHHDRHGHWDGSPDTGDRNQNPVNYDQEQSQKFNDGFGDMPIPQKRFAEKAPRDRPGERSRQRGSGVGRGRGEGRGRGLKHREKDHHTTVKPARRSPSDPSLSQTKPVQAENGHSDKPPTPPAYPESVPDLPAKQSPHKLKVTRDPQKNRDLTPDSWDSSGSEVVPDSGSEGGVLSDSRPAGARRYGPLSNNKKQQNEYDWQRSKVERRAKQILRTLSPSTIQTVTAEFRDLIHPDVSRLQALPGPKELSICLEQLVLHAVSEPEQLDDTVRLIQGLADEDDFVSVISQVLPEVIPEFIKVTTNVVTQRQRRPLVRLLARLYLDSQTWTSAAREPIVVFVTNSFDKWCEFNIKKQHPAPDALYEVYADCLGVLLEEAGHALEEQWPAKVKAGFDHLQWKALDPQIHESVRLQILDLLVRRVAGWSRPDRPTDPRTTVRRPSEHRGTQVTTQDLSNQVDQCTETQISARYSVATQTTAPPSVCDPYQRVTQMLQDLSMGELVNNFRENAIRDSVLELPFSDLRQLLREVDVKPGYVWEIKTYMENQRDTQQSKVSSRSSSAFSSSSFHDLTSPEQFPDSERLADPARDAFSDLTGLPHSEAHLFIAPHRFQLLTPSTFTSAPPESEQLVQPRTNKNVVLDTRPASRANEDTDWRGRPRDQGESAV